MTTERADGGDDAVAVPSGWLVVARCCRPGVTALTPLAWTSADGRTWQRAALPVRGRAGAGATGGVRRRTCRWRSGRRGLAFGVGG